MPRGPWIGLLVLLALGGTATAQDTRALLPPVLPAFPVAPGPSDPPLRDLTPPGFDLVPPPDPHRANEHGTAGHLAPTVPGHAGWYGSAEYLLYRPRAGSFDFAIGPTAPGLATVGPVQSLRYDVGNGLRAEGGYRFASGWGVGFAYTYLSAVGGRSLTAPAGAVLLPTLTRPGLTDTATSAETHANLNYNLYDVLVGKRLAFDDNLALRLFAGVRIADITQRFDVRYDGLDARRAAVDTQSAFGGFGPVAGTEAILGGWYGFHAYGRATGGLLTGRSINSFRETNNGGGTVYVDSRYDVTKIVPVASIAIGGGWQYRTVSLRAGYEVTHWFGLTGPLRFTDDVAQGRLVAKSSDLSLEGFFVQVGIVF